MHKIENLDYKEKQIILHGYCTEEDYSVLVFSGKKCIFDEASNVSRPDLRAFHDKYNDKQLYGFSFKIPCDKAKFSIYIKSDNKLLKIYKTNNYFIRKKLSNIKQILLYIKKSLVILWKDYHFLVPFSKWKSFAKTFYNKVVKRGILNDNFYNLFSVDDYNKWLTETYEETNYEKLKY